MKEEQPVGRKSRVLREVVVLAGLALLMNGCLWALPFLITNDFDDKRSALKQNVEKGLITPQAGEAECLRMLDKEDRGHTTPSLFPPEVCRFGSFADQRYELVKAVQQGTKSPDAFVQECLVLSGKPETGEPCKYDPVGDQLAQLNRLVEQGRIPKEAAEYECPKLLSSAKPVNGIPARSPAEVCKF